VGGRAAPARNGPQQLSNEGPPQGQGEVGRGGMAAIIRDFINDGQVSASGKPRATSRLTRQDSST
jgi:hypothetical protein